jgi:hypothetical protein
LIGKRERGKEEYDAESNGHIYTDTSRRTRMFHIIIGIGYTPRALRCALQLIMPTQIK